MDDHVADLRELVETLGAGAPALVGSSWGAMLALAFAAAHPGLAGPLVLIGCGTFDRGARARFHAVLAKCMDASSRRRRLIRESLERYPADRVSRVGALWALPLAGESGAGEFFSVLREWLLACARANFQLRNQRLLVELTVGQQGAVMR